MIKTILSLCLVLSSLFSSMNLLCAEDDEGDTVQIIYYSEEEINDIAAQELEKLLSQLPTPRMDSYVYVSELVETSRGYYSPYYDAFNQYAGGVKFTNSGSGFNWTDSSKTAGTFNFSVSFNVGKVASISVGVTPGQVVSTAGTYLFTCPQSLIGQYVKLQIRKQFIVKRYAVYRYYQYSGPSTKEFYAYQDVTVENGLESRIIKAQ